MIDSVYDLVALLVILAKNLIRIFKLDEEKLREHLAKNHQIDLTEAKEMLKEIEKMEQS